jgi:hypothetical protein
MTSFRRWRICLAEFGNWDHSSEPPDLPAEYADAPSFSNAVATPACGIELTEIMHNKKLPKKMQQKRICSWACIHYFGLSEVIRVLAVSRRGGGARARLSCP